MNTKKSLSFILVMVVMLCLAGAGIAAVAESNTPVVTNTDNEPLLNNGASYVTGSVNVLVRPESDASYYYYLIDESMDRVEVYYDGWTDNPVGSYFYGSLVNGALVTILDGVGFTKGKVDVYYDGVTNNPVGSYFDGSLVNGTLVTTLDSGSVSGIKVDSSYTISVPMMPGETNMLNVVAYKNGNMSEVFRHTFTYPEAEFNVIHAVYGGKGALVAHKVNGFKAGLTDVDLFGAYPLGEYTHKIFCWDKNYIPLYNPIVY